MNFSTFFIAIAFLLFALQSIAQQNIALQPKVEVIARPLKDQIKIRWAPSTPALWSLANTYGYNVQRITVLRNGKVLDKPELLAINEEPIKPLPLEKWEKLVKTNKYAAIAAQALYGKSFNLVPSYGSPMSVMNQVTEQESRFSYALFACSYAIEVANAAGLVLIDKRAKENEKYLYRVIAAVPKNMMKVDTGFVYVGIKDFKELPKPRELVVEVSEKAAMLRWNNSLLQDTYSSYIIERSDDGKTFTTLNEGLPSVTTSEKKELETNFYMDTLPVLEKRYTYRIKGISYFGEIGPSSDTASGYAYSQIKEVPAVLLGEVFANKTVKLT